MTKQNTTGTRTGIMRGVISVNEIYAYLCSTSKFAKHHPKCVCKKDGTYHIRDERFKGDIKTIKQVS